MTILGFPERRIYQIYRYAWSGLDWIFPPNCGGCGVRGARYCSNCLQNTRIIPERHCQCCGRELNTAGLCSACRSSPPIYELLRSWAHFEGPIRTAIHRLKYSSNLALGEYLARKLVSIVRRYGWAIDLVVPVPLGDARLNQRGYNQAALLARPVSIACRIRYCAKALKKIRDTQTQVGLGYEERHLNVSDAFHADERKVANKNVLVVDDVVTSGATINECARALKMSGATNVIGITLARAHHHYPNF